MTLSRHQLFRGCLSVVFRTVSTHVYHGSVCVYLVVYVRWKCTLKYGQKKKINFNQHGQENNLYKITCMVFMERTKNNLTAGNRN